jgi:hypothetical protein
LSFAFGSICAAASAVAYYDCGCATVTASNCGCEKEQAACDEESSLNPDLSWTRVVPPQRRLALQLSSLLPSKPLSLRLAL